MKKIIFFLLFQGIFFQFAFSQTTPPLTRLIPTTRSVPQIQTPVPNYGHLLQASIDMINLTLATLCHRELQQQLDDAIWAERGKLKKEKDFQVIFDYTDCEVMLLPCSPPCSGTVLSKPGKNIHSYIVQLIPIIRDKDGKIF